MSGADYLLLALLGGWFLFVLLHRRKKGCHGGCANCGQCGCSCQKERKQ